MAKNSGTMAETLGEFTGTFTFILIGAGTGALAGNNGGGIVAVALAHGLGIMTMAYAFGAVSGAHLNPAITFALGLTGRISWSKTMRYWAAQFAAALVAGVLLHWLLGTQGNLGATTGSLTGADPFKAVAVEALLTFFLASAVFGSAVANRNGNAFGLAIGMVVAMDILMGGSLTGASMNPARSFAPAVGLGDFSSFYIDLIGPLAGAGAAGLLWDRMFLK
jgi:MIP family channel proteins